MLILGGDSEFAIDHNKIKNRLGITQRPEVRVRIFVAWWLVGAGGYIPSFRDVKRMKVFDPPWTGH